MDQERRIRVVQDSKGRKIALEVSSQPELIGVVISEGSGEEQLFAPAGVAQKAAETAESLHALVSDIASSILEGLKTNPKPSKVNIEFGVELSAEAGIWFVSKGTASASIKVCMEWKTLPATS